MSPGTEKQKKLPEAHTALGSFAAVSKPRPWLADVRRQRHKSLDPAALGSGLEGTGGAFGEVPPTIVNLGNATR